MKKISSDWAYIVISVVMLLSVFLGIIINKLNIKFIYYIFSIICFGIIGGLVIVKIIKNSSEEV